MVIKMAAVEGCNGRPEIRNCKMAANTKKKHTHTVLLKVCFHMSGVVNAGRQLVAGDLLAQCLCYRQVMQF